MVDRPDVVRLDLAAGLEQILDEVDAPARAVALVALRDIGRAGRGAEAAMHARAQNAFEFADVRIGERFGGELGLHGLASTLPVVHAAEIQGRRPDRSSCLRRRLSRQAQGGRRLEHLDRGAERIGRAHQRRVALGRRDRAADRRRRGFASAAVATQTRPPPQSKKWASAVSPRLAANGAAREGARLTRQTARSRGSAMNSASRTERHSAADSSPVSLSTWPKAPMSAASRPARSSTDSAKPSRRSSVREKLAPHAWGEPGRAADAERRA